MEQINSNTVAVTVFPDRARVTRRGRAALAPGLHRLAFRDLPLALVSDSVRAAGRGTARARLLGVNVRQEQFAETPAEAVRDLERRIESLEEQEAGLAARVSVLDNEEANLAALGGQAEVFARGLALRGRQAADVIGLLGALSERAQQLEEQKQALAREQREAGRELDRLRRELKGLHGARPRQRWVAEVEVECSEAGDLDIELSYIVNQGGWRPLYDLRLGAEDLEVTYLGEVFQDSGEDWQGVALTLSTALPALGLTLPELDPWYIEPWLPRPPAPKMAAMAARAAGPAPAPAAAPAAFEAAAPPMRMESLEMETARADVGDAGAAVTYRVGGSTDVPGDGTPRKTTVAALRLAPRLDYVTAPKLADAAYRRAQVKNDTPYVFLPGAAQLFEGDEYLGATRLELTAPGQEFELVLGADERVRVKRELKARDVDKKFASDRRRIRYAYEIEVENLLAGDQVVYVRDHIPVSRHEEIKVKLEFVDPKAAEQSELNQLEWKVALGPGQKRTVRYEYMVEAPRAMEIRGMV